MFHLKTVCHMWIVWDTCMSSQWWTEWELPGIAGLAAFAMKGLNCLATLACRSTVDRLRRPRRAAKFGMIGLWQHSEDTYRHIQHCCCPSCVHCYYIKCNTYAELAGLGSGSERAVAGRFLGKRLDKSRGSERQISIWICIHLFIT